MKARGFTLIELLIAAAVTGTVLAATFGWLWNVAAVAHRADDRAQATTIAAACTRAVMRDVAAAVAVGPPTGQHPARALALRHDRPDVAEEHVLVVWDPSRGVLWRNASGTYLGDHVTGFAVAYVMDDGGLVAGGDMQAGHWAAVRGVRVDLAVTVGSCLQERTFFVAARTP
ncbi:MAG: type II secretion system protein [Actinobacteria bacterium]|nr:type II secretion system protein [Actinomycetota bacterium]